MAGMTRERAEGMATFVGWFSVVAGAVLTVAPERSGRLLRLGERGTDLRLVGVGDVAVGAGLLLARPRWPWMIGRMAVNIVAGGLMLRLSRQGHLGAKLFAAFLAVVTVGDTQVTMKLRSERA